MRRKRQVEVKLGVWDISRCGFYVWGGEDATVDAMLTLCPSAAKWVSRQRLLSATRTECRGEDSDQPIELDSEPLLCRATAESSGDYLFAMYQVLGEGKNALSSIAVDARVNGELPQPLGAGDNRLTGASRYFWLIPAERLLCTIRIGKAATSLTQFSRWAKDFLQFHAGDVRRAWGPEDRCSLFAHDSEDAETPPKLYGRFVPMELADVTGLKRVRAAPSSIRAIWFKGRFPTRQLRSEASGLFGQLMKFLPAQPFGGPKMVDARVTMREDTPNGLTLAVVDQLVDAWRKDSLHLDVGFQLPDGPVWLSRPKPVKRTVELAFAGTSDEQVDLATLLDTLRTRFRADVLATAGTGRAKAKADDGG